MNAKKNTDKISYHKPLSFYKQLNGFDWVFALAVIGIAIFSQNLLNHHMDGYEKAILGGAAIVAIALGWFFKPMRLYFLLSAILTYISIHTYAGDITRADAANKNVHFLLKYFLASQTAIIWMSALIFIATFCYLIGLFTIKKTAAQNNNTFLNFGTHFTWIAALMGFVALLVRWHESYLISPDTGHIPVSNLYEVFVLLIIFTLLMYLYYEAKYSIQRIGGFILSFVSLVVIFLIWYTLTRQAQEIQPLVPALQSWWMKIHVPANFIGYGAFIIAAMLAVAELLILKGIGKDILPSAEMLEEIMYKAISLGFLFFTIATILGALWASEAWGRYWGWDPKETWALIVWLNYAIWLHLRLVAGWRGKVLAWWAIIGLLITTFAFVGVNMFLSGLHSYGTL